MDVGELLKYFLSHKGSVGIGAGELANRTHSRREDVVAARNIARARLAYKKENLPKILIFDIETAPVKAFVWKLWKENVALDLLIDDWFVICWSAKWLYSDRIMGECLTTYEILQENDERIVQKLWKLFDEADIVVAHNAGNFDVPKMNVRFLKHKLVPPSPYRIVDTLQVAKKLFKFTSNKLDALATFFGFDNKLTTDFNLWKLCLEGKQEALDYMFKYNKYDVKLLESVYIKLLPWIHNHPNIANYLNEATPMCCNCGSSNLELIDLKFYKTQIGTFKIYRCKECGAISRSRTNTGIRPKTTSISR